MYVCMGGMVIELGLTWSTGVYVELGLTWSTGVYVELGLTWSTGVLCRPRLATVVIGGSAGGDFIQWFISFNLLPPPSRGETMSRSH